MDLKLIVGNWKAHKTVTEATEWVDTFLELERRDNRHYVVCPPFPHLPFLLELTEEGIEVGVQDLSPYGAGPYTGEVAAYNLQNLGVKYAIVGHSERRKYLLETSQMAAQKAEQALDFQITPIVCVDRGQIEEQARFFTDDQKQRLIVAYEPLHAISTFGGETEPIEQVLSVIEDIKSAFGEGVPVLYGGSVDADNSLVYLEQERIAGVLVGQASLDPIQFAKL